MNFDWEIYKLLNPDLAELGLITIDDFKNHFTIKGKRDGRKYNIFQLYPFFNHYNYRDNNEELKHMNMRDLEIHWLSKGRYENKSYSIKYNKISIVMTYYNRKSQLIATLDTFKKYYSGKYNFEVIIVDDCSTEEHKLDETIIDNYKFKIIYRYISEKEKGMRVNPCVAYNIGFSLATGDVIIIQNPECYHCTDIIYSIPYLSLNYNYYTTLVISSPSFEHNEFIVKNSGMMCVNDIVNYLENSNNIYSHVKSKGWYNHPIYQDTDKQHLHFCSIILKSKLDLLGGFDETYANNYWYDDNEFLFRVKKILTPIFLTESLVVHLFHENGSATHNTEYMIASKEINRLKYETLKKTRDNNVDWRKNIKLRRM